MSRTFRGNETLLPQTLRDRQETGAGDSKYGKHRTCSQHASPHKRPISLLAQVFHWDAWNSLM